MGEEHTEKRMDSPSLTDAPPPQVVLSSKFTFSFPDLAWILSIARPNLDIFQSVIDPSVFLSRFGLSLMFCLFAANIRLCVGKVGRPRPIPGDNYLS